MRTIEQIACILTMAIEDKDFNTLQNAQRIIDKGEDGDAYNEALSIRAQILGDAYIPMEDWLRWCAR